MDSICDGCSNPGQTDLSDPACADFVDLFVGVLEEGHVDWRRVGIYRDDVVRETAVDGRTVLRIVGRVFEQRHADTHHHRALNLVSTGEGIEDPSCINDRHDPADPQASDLRLPRNLDEVTTE